jgi:hypothetical protein
LLFVVGELEKTAQLRPGSIVGAPAITSVGNKLGCAVGLLVVGAGLGTLVGVALGTLVGTFVGTLVGDLVGIVLGAAEGL